MRISLDFVGEGRKALQGRNDREINSEDQGAAHKNSRRLSWPRFRSRRWFLAVTCYPPVAFAQVLLQELEIAVKSGEDVVLPSCAGFPIHVVLEVQRNGTLKTAGRQRIHKILPVHHPFSHRTVRGHPARLRFFPSKIFDGDHLQARHHKVRCDLPASDSPFSHGMTSVEVEASPLRLKCVYHRGHVPNRRSDVLLVIVVPRLDSILLAKADETTELTGCFFEFSPHVDHLILVITRLEERNRKLGRGREDYARRRVVRRSELGGDHRDVQPFSTDRLHRFGEIFGSTLWTHVPAPAYREVNPVESHSFGGLSQSAPIHVWQWLREEAKRPGIAIARMRY